MKIKDLSSEYGKYIGDLGAYIMDYEEIQSYPSYVPSANQYGFGQYLNYYNLQNITVAEKSCKFPTYVFSTSIYFTQEIQTPVIDDVEYFIERCPQHLLRANSYTSRTKTLLSSSKIGDNRYILTVLQFSSSWSGIISYLCDQPELLYDGTITQGVEPYQTVGQGTIPYYVLACYPYPKPYPSDFGYINLTPVYIQSGKNVDNFYSTDEYIVGFIPFTVYVKDTAGEYMLMPESYPPNFAYDPTLINKSAVWNAFDFQAISGIELVTPEDPVDPDEPIDPVFPYYPPSDPIVPPPKPPVNPITSGLVNAYKMNAASLESLHDLLFPTFTEEDFDENPLVNLANEFKWIWNTLKSGQSNQYIISCHGLPVTPTTGSNESIKLGNFTYQVSAPKITDGYVDFDFGTISLDEIYHGFEDYAYTDIQLYLPFGIGYVPLPNEFIQGGSMKIIYRFNVADGTFIAYIISTSSKSNLANSVVRQYSGSAVSNIPMTGSNYSQLISNVVTSGVASAVTQNPLPLVNEGLNIVNEMQPLPSGNNDMSSSPSLMTVRKPYLIISRSMSNYPNDYAKIQGKPSLISGKLSEFSGYTECIINVNQLEFEATKEDKDEIINLLTNGIII